MAETPKIHKKIDITINISLSYIYLHQGLRSSYIEFINHPILNMGFINRGRLKIFNLSRFINPIFKMGLTTPDQCPVSNNTSRHFITDQNQNCLPVIGCSCSYTKHQRQSELSIYIKSAFRRWKRQMFYLISLICHENKLKCCVKHFIWRRQPHRGFENFIGEDEQF